MLPDRKNNFGRPTSGMSTLSSARVKTSASAVAASVDNCKDSIALYAAMNEIGMAKLKDKILPSQSTLLTKEQRTRLSYQLKKDELEQ